MPIYEYVCNDCERPFEELVLSTATPVSCPVCDGTRIERLMSVVNTRSTAEPACMAEKTGGMPGGGCCGGGRCGLQ